MKNKIILFLVFLLGASELNAQSFVWTRCTNFSGGTRYSPFGFSIGNKGYVGGGVTFPGGVFDYNHQDFWEFNPSTNSWTQMANFPGVGRNGSTGFSIGTKGYVTLGWSPSQLNDLWQYDPAANSWQQKTNFGGAARYDAAVFVIDSFAYVGTGYAPWSKDFWKYDPSSDSWSQVADIGGAERQCCAGFAIDSLGYVYGGSQEFNAYTNDLWQYSPNNNTWTQKTSFPGNPRTASFSFVMSGKGYVGCGSNSSTVYDDFYEYNPLSDSWQQVSEFGGGIRMQGVSFTIGNKGYAGFGSPSIYPNVVETDDFWSLEYVDANNITGKLYMDFNNNNTQDVGEVPLANHLISEANTGRIAFSRADGSYELSVLDSGNFSVTTDSSGYFNPNPLSNTAYFSGINLVDSLNDFAFQAPNQFNDLEVTITPLGAFRPGFDASYEITYSNIGTTVISNPVLYFMLDTSVTYITSSDVPSTLGTDTISWNLTSLNPFQGGSIIVTVNVSSITPIGTEINCPVILEPTLNDINTYNNYDTWAVTVTGSYDPNDIAVNRETLLTTEFPNPPYLDYVIRFQNTGTDTAFTVDVINQLPMEVDVNSFEFVSSSHPVVIRSIPEYNSLGFKFNNILLVDSNMNEAMSHGFIHYRIKPLSTLVQGNQIANSAGIYFDFNAPVLTNTAITTVVTPTGVKNVVNSTASVVAYPNPANDKLNVLVNASVPSTGKIYLTDITGRKVIIQESTLTAGKNKVELNTTKLNAGAYFLTVEYGTKKEVIKVLIK